MGFNSAFKGLKEALLKKHLNFEKFRVLSVRIITRVLQKGLF